MKSFGLENCIPVLKSKNGTKLSRGQTQKINIIYSIINIMYANIRILLLDESTSNIDEPTEVVIFNELRTLHKKHPFTCIFVSHNLNNVRFADYEYKMSVETQSVSKKNVTDSVREIISN